MKPFSLNDIKNFEIDISIESVLISLLISAIGAYFVKLIYIRFAKTINNKENFSDIFVLLAITTTVVITVVKYSLALSLGLVGALSIVRFRAAIKEPEELVYLFLIIGIGLAAGSNQYQVAIILITFSYFVIFLENKFRKKKIIANTEILNIEIDAHEYDEFLIHLNKLINANQLEISLKSLNKQDDKMYITYLVKNIYKITDFNNFVSELKKMPFKNFNFNFSKNVDLFF